MKDHMVYPPRVSGESREIEFEIAEILLVAP